MSWYNLFKIAQDDGYGCWVSPSGEVINVEYMGHRKKAEEILVNNFGESPDSIRYMSRDAKDELLDKGYVLVINSNFSLQSRQKLPYSQFSSLMRLLNDADRAGSSSYTFDAEAIRVHQTYTDILMARRILGKMK